MSGLLRSAVKASVTLGCLTLLPAMHAIASSGVVDVIQKKYLVTEFSTDHNQVTKDGTTMDLKCAGVYSLPVNMTMMSAPPDNQVADGKIKSQNFMVKSILEKLGAHVLQTGDKVYITKIDSKNDPKGDVLRFTVQSADSFDVTGQSSQQKFTAVVSFHFKKGYLDEAAPDEVEQAIEAIMSPDTGTDQAQAGNNSQGGGQAQSQQQGPPQRAAGGAPQNAAGSAPQNAAGNPQQTTQAPAATPSAPAGPPPTITIGESSTQVLQAMGMPQQMIDLGKKKTFVYKNMKVIFVDDKVSDVQ
jgi:hypothetical protein